MEREKKPFNRKNDSILWRNSKKKRTSSTVHPSPEMKQWTSAEDFVVNPMSQITLMETRPTNHLPMISLRDCLSNTHTQKSIKFFGK